MTSGGVPRPIAVNGHLGGTANSFVGGGAGLPETTHPAARPTPPGPSNQPATSMSTSAVPAKLKTDTRPSAPKPTVTMLGTTPTMALRFDDWGWGCPDGHTDRYVDAVG